MTYWRMQLHPNDPAKAMHYTSRSLSAGFIGLDFGKEVGDLNRAKYNQIPKKQRGYIAFCTDMKISDKVLIIVHHFPFAIVTVAGDYNYILRTEPELGIWFRHFRRVKDIKYFSDYYTDARSWEQYIMINTISILKDTKSKSYQLIKEMSRRSTS